ncbi:formyltransferase [Sapientia aquatica]|uniref:Formyltransferase n=1 Tax=Sapientia aquatica TaxID=1549640 RepID=A0A4R5W7D2_9BURK|nr:formyltransferase [Sapientia aquatica]TDK68175.1 formyltransferase [Sapientia aquatica]
MTDAHLANRAVVFAYHSVGVHSIKVLLARGIDIALVVTHNDNPNETIWFESVAALCAEHGIPTLFEPEADALFNAVKELAPDFIFSFYYRNMLPVDLLALAKRGAYNLHGSLLPKYRGRVPVNWAVLHGETETGATLHAMEAKPDAGAIIAQTAVPILPDDTAFDVFGKLTVASEQTLWHAIPQLLAGTAPTITNELSQGSYFGGRKPEDGRINWQQTGQQVYNLHRAVAPPYPGAFTDQNGHRFIIKKARLTALPKANLPQGICVVDNVIFGVCGDEKALNIAELIYEGKVISPETCKQLLESS